MRQPKVNQLTLIPLLIIATIINEARTQQNNKIAILNAKQQEFQFGYSELFEIYYDNSKKQKILEFTVTIKNSQKSPVQNFDKLCFLLFASLQQLDQDKFVQDILDVRGSRFESYKQQKNVRIISIDHEGLASAKKTLALQILDQAKDSQNIYFYVFGPYQFGEEQALTPPPKSLFTANFTIKDKMTCQNNCNQDKQQGKCMEEDGIAYCECSTDYIDRDCSKKAVNLKIEPYFCYKGDDPVLVVAERDEKTYIYFDITDEDFEFKKNLIIDLNFTTKTTGIILQSLVDFTNLAFYIDYLLWLHQRGLQNIAGQISSERRQYAMSMSENTRNSRIILLVKATEGSYLNISVYKFEASSSDNNPSLLILYIILGALGFIVLLYIIYIAYRSKNLRRENLQLVQNLQLHQAAANEAAQRRAQQQTTKLKQEQVDEYMPTKKYDSHLKNTLNSDQCSVCLEEFVIDKDQIKSTICQHIFHSDCLSEWLKKQQNCPFCRQELSLEKLKEYKLNPAAYQQISGIKVKQEQVQPSNRSNHIINKQNHSQQNQEQKMNNNQVEENNQYNHEINSDNQKQKKQKQNEHIISGQIHQPIGKNMGQRMDEEQVHMNGNNLFNQQDDNTNVNNTAIIHNQIQEQQNQIREDNRQSKRNSQDFS